MASELEQQRLANIASNQALLASLNLPALTEKPVPKKKGGSAKRVKREGTEEHAIAVPTRRSARHSTVIQTDPEEAEKVRKRQREEEEAHEESIAQAKRARHEDRVVEVIYRTGREWKSDGEKNTSSAALKLLLDGLSSDGRITRKQADSAGQPAHGENSPRGPADIVWLREQVQDLVLRKTEKVTPERVYSMMVHPTLEKDLVFMGDKSGALGIADALASDEAEANEEDQSSTTSWAIRAHAKSAITCIRLNPKNARLLYTAGYDCTLRSIDFETRNSVEVVDADLLAAADYGEGEALLSGFDVTADGNELWVSDNRGGVTHHDTREHKSKAKRWQVSINKVGCISLNPLNENLLVTAQLNRDMRVFDVRKLMACDNGWARDQIDEVSVVAEYSHGKACSSAYFDPSGRHLLSTSYDDKMRIWDIDAYAINGSAFEPTRVVKHDNQTGRYVSVFKAQWSPNTAVAPHWTSGNMRRSIDIYAYNGTLLAQLYDASAITAVPAITASHPNRADRAYGGNGSGKLYVWAPAEASEVEV